MSRLLKAVTILRTKQTCLTRTLGEGALIAALAALFAVPAKD
jgi:hypothetical protein